MVSKPLLVLRRQIGKDGGNDLLINLSKIFAVPLQYRTHLNRTMETADVESIVIAEELASVRVQQLVEHLWTVGLIQQ